MGEKFIGKGDMSMTFAKIVGTSNNSVLMRTPCQICGTSFNPDLAKKRFSSNNS